MTVGGVVEKAVRTALRASKVDPKDKATAELAVRYAVEIDLGGDLAKLGPALLNCLAALLLTPAARAAALKGVPGADTKPGSRLDELRERRARKGRAAAVDAASS